jgi:hypothetical protein
MESTFFSTKATHDELEALYPPMAARRMTPVIDDG